MVAPPLLGAPPFSPAVVVPFREGASLALPGDHVLSCAPCRFVPTGTTSFRTMSLAAVRALAGWAACVTGPVPVVVSLPAAHRAPPAPEASPMVVPPARPGAVVSSPLVAAPASAPGRRQSIIDRARCSAHPNAALHLSIARVERAQASPTRHLSGRHAPRIPSAQPGSTVVAFPMTAWLRLAGVRTTSAPATRVVERGRPASAAAHRQTTAPIFALPQATAPWTRIAAHAGIALHRWRLALLQTQKPWSRA